MPGWFMRLRALLIQKDTKPVLSSFVFIPCLRALLIQKDTKQSIKHLIR